jgi:hypothetical protein
MADPRPWFAPKTHGYGATPVTWEGWALVLGFAALVGLAGWLLVVRQSVAGAPPAILNIIAFALVTAMLAGGLIVISKAKSSAEWHWRWGETDKLT